MEKRFVPFNGPDSYPASHVVNGRVPLGKILFHEVAGSTEPTDCPKFGALAASPLEPPVDEGETRQFVQVWCSSLENAALGTTRICGLTAIDCPFQSRQGVVSAPDHSEIPVVVEAFNPKDKKPAQSYVEGGWV